MQLTKIVFVCLCLSVSMTAFARTLAPQSEGGSPIAAFENVKMVPPVNIVVPTAVEVPLSLDVSERNNFAVYENSSAKFVPYFIHETYSRIPASVTAYSEASNNYALTDSNSDTGVDYFLKNDGMSSVTITLTASEFIESSSLVLELDEYVALPTTLSMTALVEGAIERTIIAPIRMYSNVVTFPKTVAKQWTVSLTYAQPLRINELRLVQDQVESTVVRGIRFLAQPQSTYMIYHNPDRGVRIPTIEQGNLSDNDGVLLLPKTASMINQTYTQADVDDDGVIDIRDNCVQMANADQLDVDRNGRGDVCDDFDRDGISQIQDNCPNLANLNQIDTDGDGIGDACDTEESRFTEKYPWVPWAGMGIAALVLGALFVLMAAAPKKEEVS